jgi:ABC-type polysaccharide/polyol phosphate export permease
VPFKRSRNKHMTPTMRSAASFSVYSGKESINWLLAIPCVFLWLGFCFWLGVILFGNPL